MNNKYPSFLKSYGFSIILIISIVIGAIIGIIFKKDAAILKPFGDIFLNLLFTAIIPLVFFSISSAVAGMTNIRRLGKILSAMILVFVITGVIASIVMLIGVILYPPAVGVHVNFGNGVNVEHFKASDQIVKAFTVSDFTDLLSKKNMLALIIFAVLTGLATSASGERGKNFANFLTSASQVMMKLIFFIMYYAPIGLCAYFAYLVGVFGPELLGSYARVVTFILPDSYFVLLYCLHSLCLCSSRKRRSAAFLAQHHTAVSYCSGHRKLYSHNPANLEAADKTGVPQEISEFVIPVGATMHMEGSCLAAVVKIAFLFGIFNMSFSGVETIATALGIALLVGVVVSGIPGGGTIGEILIISVYGFPMESFPLITMIGTLVDAPATMVNAVGDNVSSILVARIMGGKDWMKEV